MIYCAQYYAHAFGTSQSLSSERAHAARPFGVLRCVRAGDPCLSSVFVTVEADHDIPGIDFYDYFTEAQRSTYDKFNGFVAVAGCRLAVKF